MTTRTNKNTAAQNALIQTADRNGRLDAKTADRICRANGTSLAKLERAGLATAFVNGNNPTTTVQVATRDMQCDRYHAPDRVRWTVQTQGPSGKWIQGVTHGNRPDALADADSRTGTVRIRSARS